MKESLLQALTNRTLLGDGAMGTELQAAGLDNGACGEHWNLVHPDRIEAIQRRYVEAGSDLIITNTFGGCRIMLTRHGHGADTVPINREASAIARRAFGDRPGFVLGSIGPFGGLMEPYGDQQEGDVREAFEEQAKALVDGGVDAIILETHTMLEEIGIGIEAARQAGAPCVIGSFAYDVTHDGSEIRTMMGINVESAAEFVAQAGADMIALNCGTGVDMDWAAKAAERYRAACGLPVMVQPNAGLPVVKNQVTTYPQTPAEMAACLPGVVEAGASIIGGCCGSTPVHIAALREGLDALLPQEEDEET